MNIVNFYNKERDLIMQFKDFQFKRDEVLQIVNFNGVIDFDFFHFETNFEAEEYDFRNFLLSLEKMNKREQSYIVFSPLSDTIMIKLSEKMGKIDVEVNIYNNLFTAKLEFKYCIDQSFLPELIDEIEKVFI